MKSSIHPTPFVLLTIVMVSYLSILSTPSTAQVYQMQADGSLRYVPQFASPNFQSPTFQPPIFPGQIINGERVIAASPATGATPKIQTPAETVSPPAPPQSSATTPKQTEPAKPQKKVRHDKIPPTMFPIPNDPPNLSSDQTTKPETSPVFNQTPSPSQSSIAPEENLETAQTKPSQQDALVDDALVENTLEENTLEENTFNSTSSDSIAPTDLAPPELGVNLGAMENPSTELPESSATTPPIDEDVMAEIKEIRDQLGGSISESLQAMDLSPNLGPIEITPAEQTIDSQTSQASDNGVSPEQIFDEELRSVMSEQTNYPASTLAEPTTTSSDIGQPNSQPIFTPYADRTKELRSCARELEQLAGRLEAIEAYQIADDLRRQAAELWTKARQR